MFRFFDDLNRFFIFNVFYLHFHDINNYYIFSKKYIFKLSIDSVIGHKKIKKENCPLKDFIKSMGNKIFLFGNIAFSFSTYLKHLKWVKNAFLFADSSNFNILQYFAFLTNDVIFAFLLSLIALHKKMCKIRFVFKLTELNENVFFSLFFINSKIHEKWIFLFLFLLS